MDENQLDRTLRSIGKTCFVRFFEDFSSLSKSQEDVIETLKSNTNYTNGSCVSRTSHARRIIHAGLATQALKIVISSDSPRVSEDTKQRARALLHQA